jgi:flagellar protein FlaG
MKMINGIIEKRAGLEIVPGAKTRERSHIKAEKAVKEEEKVTNSDDLKKQENIDISEAMERVAGTAKLFNRKIQLEVDRESDMVIVKIVDSETNEVIRQVPPEELVRLSKNATDLKGLLIDKEG